MSILNMRVRIGVCCAAIMLACSAHAETALTISSPLELQVIQRSSKDQAAVIISGTFRGAADVVEARADMDPRATRGKATGWTRIAKEDDFDGEAFSGQISLEAGGWYVVTVRARRGDEIIGEVKIMKVGVGDVFITAGQSNSANYGNPRQVAKDSRVVYFNGESFVPAKDPIPGGCGGGGSVWPILGDHIVKLQRVPVCFRSTSQTWTEVKNWLPGVKCRKFFLYTNLVECTSAFGKEGVRAVLWHQGESDSLAKTSSETYFNRLKKVIDSLNTDVAYEIPWFVAQASFHPGSKEPEEEAVAAGQHLLWKRGIAHKGPITDDLGQEYRSDNVHFNQRGLTEHAARWFESLCTEYNWQADPSGKSK